MAEFRRDPLRGHTVLINGQRGNRPSEFSLKIETPDDSNCAFCRGHEDSTPPSIEQDQALDWNWRLFPNRFPAVLEHPAPLVENEFTQAAVGRHEVLVETAHHYAQAHEYGIEQWVEIFHIWQRRLTALYVVEEIQYVHIFRNQGYRGGATLVHPHQQIVGLPLIPDAIAKRIEIVQHVNQCPHCAWINREANDGVRVLENHEDMIAITAFAPRFPFEWQIYPKTHENFEEIEVANLQTLARMLRNGLIALKETCGNPDFNLVLFSVPGRRAGRRLWGLDVLPRISTQAGFEWGTGVHIVSTPPEEACWRLRTNWPV